MNMAAATTISQRDRSMGHTVDPRDNAKDARGLAAWPFATEGPPLRFRHMRVLMLVNSNDTKTHDKGAKRFDIIGQRLEQEFGEPVEVITRSIWPRESMPQAIGKWMDEFEPDMVYLNVVAIWFQYESVPLRARRLFGLRTRTVGNAVFNMANAKWWMRNAAFRGVRNTARWVVGGDHHFTADEVIERVGESVRIISRHEDSVLLVKGARALSQHATNPYRARKAERDKWKVDAALREICAQYHATYSGLDRPSSVARRGMKHRAKDRLHLNEAGHAASANDHYGPIRDAWAAHLDAVSDSRREATNVSG
jgi:hypothetical protein